MKVQVSENRAKAFGNPFVQFVANAAQAGDDAKLRQVLADAAYGWFVDAHGVRQQCFAAMWNGFAPLPFTAESEPGKRLAAAWDEVKRQHHNCALVQEFKWFFYQPERHGHDDAFAAGVTGKELVEYNLAA